MAQGINRKGAVIEKDGADHESDNQPAPPVDQEAQPRQYDAGDPVQFIQKHQFGVTPKILHRVGFGFVVPARKNPADVRPPNALHDGGMGIIFRIRITVMVAVMGGPPQGPLLHGAATQPGQKQLKRPAGFIGFMGKIAVIPAGDPKHTNEIQSHAQNNIDGLHAGEKHRQATNMQPDKRQALD